MFWVGVRCGVARRFSICIPHSDVLPDDGLIEPRATCKDAPIGGSVLVKESASLPAHRCTGSAVAKMAQVTTKRQTNFDNGRMTHKEEWRSAMSSEIFRNSRMDTACAKGLGALVWLLLGVLLSSCATTDEELGEAGELLDYRYVIGPGDSINVFVWGNPEISTTVPVRPDGRISAPLVDEVFASGKTPSQLARDIEESLAKYVKDPLVTVMVGGFVGRFDQQIRVVGEATSPLALPYRQDMTLLDVVIAAGGLTEFASGNRAVIVRYIDGQPVTGRVRLDDLLQDGDITANVAMRPGDILIIPEAWF